MISLLTSAAEFLYSLYLSKAIPSDRIRGIALAQLQQEDSQLSRLEDLNSLGQTTILTTVSQELGWTNQPKNSLSKRCLNRRIESVIKEVLNYKKHCEYRTYSKGKILKQPPANSIISKDHLSLIVHLPRYFDNVLRKGLGKQVNPLNPQELKKISTTWEHALQLTSKHSDKLKSDLDAALDQLEKTWGIPHEQIEKAFEEVFALQRHSTSWKVRYFCELVKNPSWEVFGRILSLFTMKQDQLTRLTNYLGQANPDPKKLTKNDRATLASLANQLPLIRKMLPTIKNIPDAQRKLLEACVSSKLVIFNLKEHYIFHLNQTFNPKDVNRLTKQKISKLHIQSREIHQLSNGQPLDMLDLFAKDVHRFPGKIVFIKHTENGSVHSPVKKHSLDDLGIKLKALSAHATSFDSELNALTQWTISQEGFGLPIRCALINTTAPLAYAPREPKLLTEVHEHGPNKIEIIHTLYESFSPIQEFEENQKTTVNFGSMSNRFSYTLEKGSRNSWKLTPSKIENGEIIFNTVHDFYFKMPSTSGNESADWNKIPFKL